MQGSIVRIMIGILLTYIALGIVWYIMPYVLAATFLNNFTQVGMAIAVIPIVSIFVSIPLGYYADTGKIKRITLNALLTILVSMFLFAVLPAAYLVGLLLLGIGTEGVFIGVTAYLFNIIKKSEARYIGMEFSVMETGWFLGPILGGFVYTTSGGLGAALVSTVLLGLSYVVLSKELEEKIALKHQKPPKLSTMLQREQALIRKFPHFAVAFMLFNFIYSYFSYAVWVTVPTLILINGASIFLGGIVIGVISLPYGIGELIGGIVYRKKDKRTITIVATIMAMLSALAVAPLVQQNIYAVSLLLVVSFFLAIAYVALYSFVLERDRRFTGELTALSIIAGGLGGAVGPIIAGATTQSYGIYLLSLTFVALSLMFLVYFYVFGKDVY